MPPNVKREGFQPDDQLEDRDDERQDRQPPPPEDDTIVDLVTGEPVEPSQFKETWPLVVDLRHKKIMHKGKPISELSFREPTGGDILRIGNPVRISLDGEAVIDDRKMSWMMGQLTGLPPPVLEQMDPRDFTTCCYKLRVFFIPDLRAWLP